MECHLGRVFNFLGKFHVGRWAVDWYRLMSDAYPRSGYDYSPLFECSLFAAVEVLTDKWGFDIGGLDSVGKRIIKTKIRYKDRILFRCLSADSPSSYCGKRRTFVQISGLTYWRRLPGVNSVKAVWQLSPCHSSELPQRKVARTSPSIRKQCDVSSTNNAESSYNHQPLPLCVHRNSRSKIIHQRKFHRSTGPRVDRLLLRQEFHLRWWRVTATACAKTRIFPRPLSVRPFSIDWKKPSTSGRLREFVTRQTARLSSQSVLRHLKINKTNRWIPRVLLWVIGDCSRAWFRHSRIGIEPLRNMRHDLCPSPPGNGDLPSWCGTAPIRLFSRFALNILALHSSLSNMLDLSRQIDQHCTVRSENIWVIQRMVTVSSLISNTRIRRCFLGPPHPR